MIFPTRGCKPCRQRWQTASTAPFRKKRHHDAHWHPAPGGALTLAPSPRLCGAHATGSQARRQPLRAAAGLVPQPSVFPDKDPPEPLISARPAVGELCAVRQSSFICRRCLPLARKE